MVSNVKFIRCKNEDVCDAYEFEYVEENEKYNKLLKNYLNKEIDTISQACENHLEEYGFVSLIFDYESTFYLLFDNDSSDEIIEERKPIIEEISQCIHEDLLELYKSQSIIDSYLGA